MDKLNPGHYLIFATIKPGSNKDSIYKGTFDLKTILPMNRFQKGDSFFVRYEIRWKIPPEDFVQADTLVY